RWTAEMTPKKEILIQLIQAEGLDYAEVEIRSGLKLTNHRTQMREFIQIIEGELIFNLSGTQFALRPGDKLELPPNTLFSYNNLKNDTCTFLSSKTI
ncbi:MAG: cupin domain-containing protein, partial [Pseudobdellovibrio sp.]